MQMIAIHRSLSAQRNDKILCMENWQTRARRVMAEKKLTQRKVADLMSRSQSTFACWLSGRNTPNLDDIQALSNALGVSPAWLVYGVQSRENPIVGRILSVLQELPEEDAAKLADVFETLAGATKQ
ncbi:helix-turn-helix domain-containing protein [Aquitalea magnusonii]|uniref:helix-turn-helix domain-containing protein n=1 Tax=Aquitalea magnusonii TaxID=332411 RepID=UPI000D75510A|nr:helix-turn-helix transcriptional regulator [Aquitalea magnusonii]